LKRKLLSALLVSAATISCGGDSGPTAPVEELTESGWALFEEGNYEEALGSFEEALSSDPGHPDALNGKGWCHVQLRMLEEAAADFGSSIKNAEDRGEIQVANEARTGLGTASNNLGDHSRAAEALQAVLDSDPGFVFSRWQSIDATDVRIMLSLAKLGLAGEAEEETEVDALFDEIASQINEIDPENPISRDDPDSWRVGYSSFGSFEEAILEKLEWLIEIYLG